MKSYDSSLRNLEAGIKRKEKRNKNKNFITQAGFTKSKRANCFVNVQAKFLLNYTTIPFILYQIFDKLI